MPRRATFRKRAIHERCEALGLPSARAAREGPPGERLVVKTDLNYGGAPERDLQREWGAGGRTRRAADRVADPPLGGPGSSGYAVYRRDELPSSYWHDPALVVERFFENPDGVFFRVYVVGPATCVGEVWSDYDIKKLSLPVRRRVNHFYWASDGRQLADGASHDTVSRVVDLTRRVFRALAVDFGAADCVMGGDGTLVVVDVNPTPYWGRDVRPDVIAHLRRGIDHLLA